MGILNLRVFALGSCLVACSTAKPPEAPARAPVAKAAAPKPVPPPEPVAPVAQASAPAGEPAAAGTEGPVDSSAAAPEPEAPPALPSTCSGSGECYPDPAFAERLCRGKFPGVALALFAKSAPWRHLFVQAISIEPVNAYGGPRSDTWLNFSEEVVVLRKRGPGNGPGVRMSGPTDLDVLRWDGTCATIREELFVTYNPGQMVGPHIVWKYLDDATQEGLLKNPVIQRAQAAERKSCRDSSPNQRTPACDKAMKKLTDAIVVAVRSGAELPQPASVPVWRKSEPTASR
jgi:hypothetical protein